MDSDLNASSLPGSPYILVIVLIRCLTPTLFKQALLEVRRHFAT